jgi:hypothetical protein
VPQTGFLQIEPPQCARSCQQADGVVPGFFAEGNCCASNFRLETNFEFVDCGVIK